MIIKYLGRGALLVLGMIILGLSLIRTSLKIMAQEGVEGLKNDEVSFTMTNRFGDKETMTYKLPEAGMLPDSMFYGFKKIRDYLWLSFSNGIEKPRIALLMADKKVTEYRQLTEIDKYSLAIEAGNEAIDKLKYVNDLLLTTKPQNERVAELHRQVFRAGLAYREIFKISEEGFDIDQEKYRQLISRIDEWNQKQEKNQLEGDH